MARTVSVVSLGAVFLAALLGACGSMAQAGRSAQARLGPTRGSQVSGMVSFTQKGDDVLVVAKVSGLVPNQEHGFHLHEKGDCSSGDGMSAGGHFNPGRKPHGPQDGEHHAGDLPALKADASGNVDASFTLHGVSVGTGGADDVVGRGVIVHAQPDDYRTQPTGNSGARVACGVVT
jgi:Cu-Zn family superoxide dismutase